ncbi:MAG: class E sortase [Methanobacteriaceae archaeon]
MKLPIRISTIILAICLIVISMYAMIEISYYSPDIVGININDDTDSQVAINNTNVNFPPATTPPEVIIPKINVNESLNNISISDGVYFETLSFAPSKGDTVIFGHRTLQGSPFLNLDKLSVGDSVYVEWSGIGEVSYTVKNSTIVSSSYLLPVSNESQTLYLITCNPIGSTKERLIYACELNSTAPINTNAEIAMDNANNIDKNDNSLSNINFTPLLIAIGFLAFSAILIYFTKDKNDRNLIIIVVAILTILIIATYIFPTLAKPAISVIETLNKPFELLGF